MHLFNLSQEYPPQLVVRCCAANTGMQSDRLRQTLPGSQCVGSNRWFGAVRFPHNTLLQERTRPRASAKFRRAMERVLHWNHRYDHSEASFSTGTGSTGTASTGTDSTGAGSAASGSVAAGTESSAGSGKSRSASITRS